MTCNLSQFYLEYYYLGFGRGGSCMSMKSLFKEKRCVSNVIDGACIQSRRTPVDTDDVGMLSKCLHNASISRSNVVYDKNGNG